MKEEKKHTKQREMHKGSDIGTKIHEQGIMGNKVGCLLL